MHGNRKANPGKYHLYEIRDEVEDDTFKGW